ncbi:MAG: ABC transporter ATP-binding protein [Chloroflexi bacterium SZAS-1]|jgi:ATP-binding cassette subfamily B protein|nr:ABC transporter ATP-binding protein [Chloroflexi bacterium SZAS-1]HNP88100.1 ABC transporter ATP-binding protein [Kouleothrix sp.]
MKSLQRVFIYLKPYWLIAFGALISLLLVTASSLVSPQVLRLILDQGISQGDRATLLWASLLLIGVALVRALFSFTQGYWSEKAAQSVAYELRNALFSKLENLSFSYHDQAQTGQLMTRITSDVEQVRTFISGGMLQVVSALALLVGSLAALFSTNWKLALITLLTVPAMAAVIARFMRIVRPMFSQVQKKLGALNTVLQENLAGIRVVQAFAREPYEAERYTKLNGELLDANLQTIRGLASSFPMIFFISNLGTLAVIWFGGHQVIDRTLSLGELVAFNTYLSLLIMPIMMLGMIIAQISRAGVSAERIFEVLDAQSEVHDRPGAQPLTAVRGRVAFEGVSFRYAGGERNVLDHVSFVAEPGQTVAIMGITGSGKSTIINLIPRFYDVTTGRVTIDGSDIRDVTLESLRDQIGIVLQDTTLFSGTIRDNIAYGRPDASDADVEAAARAAQAHEFITGFTEGYATIVGERGVGLSGGQKQRIAIARALLRNPRILILDDSTSAVDAETEFQIQQALQELMHGRTSFVIAQRISTVRDADLILLLDAGTIAAQGTHDELLRTSALYGEIIDSQFGGQHQDEAELVFA